MSIDYDFTNCEVSVTFNNKQEMQEKIKAFEADCKEYIADSIYVPAYIAQTDDDKKELKARVILSENTIGVETDELADLICKHFPTANGTIGWSYAEESAGQYVRCAGGGTIYIKDGKVVQPEWKQVEELKKDIRTLLNYIEDVVGSDVDECGVAHLFSKYKDLD